MSKQGHTEKKKYPVAYMRQRTLSPIYKGLPHKLTMKLNNFQNGQKIWIDTLKQKT